MSKNSVIDAFPMATPDGQFYPGMTLRDYFAASAINGVCASESGPFFLAERAYKLADAMILARQK